MSLHLYLNKQTSNNCLKLFALGFILLFGCRKEKIVINKDLLHHVKLEVPSNFPSFVDDVNNPLTEEGIALGRLLFYDTKLSGNNNISCASCHRPELAFSDAVAQTNVGFTGIPLPRNSQALINIAWINNGFFWDGKAANLEIQANAPLTDLNEMNQKLPELEAELKQIPDYVSRFRLVFNDEIKAPLIGKALAQFQKTMISGNSRYDQFIRKESGATLTPLELNGLNLFNLKCRSCHAGELFTDDEFHNNGLDASFKNTSLDGVFLGRYRVSNNLNDLGKFKTPTLRNVQLTDPYMHDGRFITLEQVLDHYANDIKQSPTTDVLLFQKGGNIGIPLTQDDKIAIIAFLKTLTDYSFTANRKLSNPN